MPPSIDPLPRTAKRLFCICCSNELYFPTENRGERRCSCSFQKASHFWTIKNEKRTVKSNLFISHNLHITKPKSFSVFASCRVPA